MKWSIIYFESSRGENFVEKFINEQKEEIKAKYIGMIDFLEEYGPFLSRKYTKKIKKDLYELRITGKEQIRVLYTIQGRTMILLHAFKKKTQKTPLKEIKTAILRLDKI
jgi:phage-related protein